MVLNLVSPETKLPEQLRMGDGDCVYYGALNRETVKDKYPILVVN
jgi:hypothetical protein